MQNFDVAIIGYGPTGKVLARLLSDAGHSVAIVDRWLDAYPLPRAVGFDHEIKRMFYKLGLIEQVEAISRPMESYVWYNADWKVLIDIDNSVESPSGGPSGFLFNQPELERALHDDLKDRPGLSFFLGKEARTITQTDHNTSVTIVDWSGQDGPLDQSTEQTITAQYVVGCDGANSVVRNTMGSAVFDHGFDADWLVVDVVPHDFSTLPVPDAAQWCNPARPTTIVPSGVRNRRWEFMVMPGESPEDIAEESKVWELLSPWMKPEDGELVRSATYNFRSLLARGWRKGRLMIAGDAAHVMPPFMGQGMCAGLRDAWNLGWKLDAVIKGTASDDILDTYEAERGPHVDAVIRISMEMGKVVCVPDPQAAAARDEAFFSGNVPPPPELPPLPSGVLHLDDGGAPIGLAGHYLPHVTVMENGATMRLDDLHDGQSFVLLVNGLPHDSMTETIKRALVQLGAIVVPFIDTRFSDADGRLTKLFNESGAKAILMRPDFYAFGSANTAEATEAMLCAAANHMSAKVPETLT